MVDSVYVGTIRLLLYQNLAVDQYPLPGVEELFATLSGGKLITKLDLAQAYLQVLLDERSTYFCTINTLQGLYK